MIVVRNGMWARLRPSAATVPSTVARIVAKNAMMTLFFTAPCQFRLVKKSLYQRVE